MSNFKTNPGWTELQCPNEGDTVFLQEDDESYRVRMIVTGVEGDKVTADRATVVFWAENTEASEREIRKKYKGKITFYRKNIFKVQPAL